MENIYIFLNKKKLMINLLAGRVRYGWLNADTRPYPFITRRITNNVAMLTPNVFYHNGVSRGLSRAESFVHGRCVRSWLKSPSH